MKTPRVDRKFVFGIFASFVILLVVIVTNWAAFQGANHDNAIEVTKEWARLADFPLNARKLTIKTSGNMFTREFTIQFEAPVADIERWLSDSPGTKNVTPSIDGNNQHFEIEPGGGAVHAELDFNVKLRRVTVNVYWS